MDDAAGSVKVSVSPTKPSYFQLQSPVLTIEVCICVASSAAMPHTPPWFADAGRNEIESFRARYLLRDAVHVRHRPGLHTRVLPSQSVQFV